MIFKISSEKIEEFIERQHAIDGMISMHDFELWLEEQPKVGEWIPVSERLPDKNGRYLVSFKEAITNSDGLCVKYWSGEEQRWRPCNYAPSVCWRAWMPLPPAYKEGE